MDNRPTITTFSTAIDPFTGQVPIKAVPIPAVAKPRKGSTKYDEHFDQMLATGTALETTEKGYELLRRGLQRFLQYRELRDTYGIRRHLDKNTRRITLWLEKKT